MISEIVGRVFGDQARCNEAPPASAAAPSLALQLPPAAADAMPRLSSRFGRARTKKSCCRAALLLLAANGLVVLGVLFFLRWHPQARTGQGGAARLIWGAAAGADDPQLVEWASQPRLRHAGDPPRPRHE